MVNSHGRFVWYELMTTDVKAAQAFYCEVMGWGAQDASMPGSAYTLLTAGGTLVGGLMDLPEDTRKPGLQQGLEPGWLGYVGVDDVDATAARLQELGGTLQVPPMDVPNVSRLSVAVDPQMATIALFKWLNRGQETGQEAGQETGQAQPDPDAPGRVGWHELLAADWEKAFAFYSELFGWEKVDAETDEKGIYQRFSAGGKTIGGMFTKPPMVPVPSWLYYFNVGDIDDALKRVKAARGQIVDGPIEALGGRWFVQCTDPQGAIFALVGKRRHNGIGYFERVASRDPSDPRFGVACTRFG
jgi:predicted enzyme related to lactoylglutathione lyase